ncbi:MAG: flagellar hook assembly protein FlgD [Desulfomonilia bacterium]
MSAIGLDAILANQGIGTSAKAASTEETLGKNTFLNLLVKQLQYQDPLNPMENTEFTAQLAQFSTLETLTEMGEAMDQVCLLQGSVNNITALSFIGKQVSARGNSLAYTGEQIGINFALQEDAAEVLVKIYNQNGSVVRTIGMDGVSAGTVEYTWDGTDNSGNAVSPGQYRFEIEAIDYEGAPVQSTSYAMGVVTGVKYVDGVTYLIIGDKEVTISDVEKISG